MFTKMCRGQSSLRALIALDAAKTVKNTFNFNQCAPHRWLSARSLCCCSVIPQVRIFALSSQSPLLVRWVARRDKSSTSTSSRDLTGIHESLTALQIKSRHQRWRRPKTAEKGYPVAAFSTAEEYDLESLKIGIAKQQLYSVEEEEVFKVQESDRQGEDVVHIKARYNVEQEPREVFFFREGTIVFWNVSDLEISNFLRFIKPFEHNSYNERLVMNEREMMSYIHGDVKKSALCNDVIELSNPRDSSLEKYSFSNGIALSVKLGVWEASLEKFIDSIEFISEDLKAGRKIKMTREEVLRKQGELFALRHLINLSSDLLDTPDFYWDNEDLEKLYLQTVTYFCINRRTRVMNEKISHCAELVELVSSHLSDKHHVRLEWMIIILIMVEVGFEYLHYMGG